ncbi:MAG: porphobilinogen synthase [Bacteroidota bacterium]
MQPAPSPSRPITASAAPEATQRPERLRRTASLRQLVRETTLAPSDFIYPVFVTPGRDIQRPIASMPGVFQWSPDAAVRHVQDAAAMGIRAVLLFGIPAEKDARGSGADADTEAVQETVRRLKTACPEMTLITDVCLCEYTDHGHCGLIAGPDDPEPLGTIRTQASLRRHAAVACSHARAGADVVAPSSMFDGVVGAIRRALDAEGYTHVAILSYAVKYASAYYGPFRDAAESAPTFGDRRAHQMDPANVREALREARLDVEQGADLLMVKPALPYLDVVQRVRVAHPDRPLAAYQVSGEYAMMKAAAERGWVDERGVALEALTGIKRAGADLIITYYALEAARWLREDT